MHKPRLILIGCVLTLSVPAGTIQAAPDDTELISVRLPGQVTAADVSSETRISTDGRYVVFSSIAADLLPGDANRRTDIFVRTLQTGAIERVNVSSLGSEANSTSDDPAISADGRYVVFRSVATNLVPGDTNGWPDIFLRDRQTGQTERVNLGPGGVQTNAFSDAPSISADGRYVAYRSRAANLVPGDTQGFNDIFVRDRQTGLTERISIGPNGAQGNAYSADPSISADGRYVAFSSSASNLVPGDTNITTDVFVRDRQTGLTERISESSSGTQANGGSDSPWISADGRYVAFGSYASNLVTGDTNGTGDVFVHDRETGQTIRVSVDSNAGQSNGHSFTPSINSNGRYVAFISYASNLVPGDSNGATDIFVRDRQTGATQRVNVDASGGQAKGSSDTPSINGDGRYVAFASSAFNLVSGDRNGTTDIFVRDRQASTTIVVSKVGVPSVAAGRSGTSEGQAISADGLVVAFSSYASNLVPGDNNGSSDIFVRDRQTGQTEQVNVSSSGEPGNTDSYLYAYGLSGDGRYVAFESTATNLVIGDNNAAPDVFIRDRQTGTTELVSVTSEGLQADKFSGDPAISADGRYVAFTSYASNLVPDDRNGVDADTLVRDRLTGHTERVSVNSSGVQANSYSYTPSINGDGRYVAFVSYASNLVAGDTNETADVFVHDRQARTTRRVSVSSSGVQANAFSYGPSMSNNGRYVLFVSSASNLVAGDSNGEDDLFVHDRQTLITERVASSAASGSISGAGRYVAFASSASNLVPGDSNANFDIFVRDRQTGQTERASVNSSGVQADGGSNGPSISVDGRTVAFVSAASNLVAGHLNTSDVDMYVHERSALSYTLTPATVNFGTLALNSSAVRSVTLANTGSLVLPIGGIEILGADRAFFTFTQTCGSSVAVGASCTISLTFRPTSAGAKSATLRVVAGHSVTQTSALTGTGISAKYTLTPTSLSFGNQRKNTTSAVRVIEVRNTGAVALPINGIALGGANPAQFARTTTCGASLAVAAFCQIKVVFKPTSTGTKTATLSVNAGAGAGTKTVALSGVGVT